MNLPESGVNSKWNERQISYRPATLRSCVDFVSSTDTFDTVKLPTSEGTTSSEQQALSIVAPNRWFHLLK